jgi:PIN domain nuclease of toxin-antitoxin system
LRLLLDTHVWLWAIAEPHRLSASARNALLDETNELHLSAASAWEIAIKWRLGRLTLPEPPESFVPGRLVRDGIRSLPVEQHHALGVASLPAHHADPFDRLLVAQALAEGLTVVTADPAFDAYAVATLRS